MEQNKDCSPGDSSERLLQRGSGGRSVYKILVKGRVQCSQALTLQKVFCWSQGADVATKESRPFLDMRGSLVVSLAESRMTLCDPMDCSPPGSSVHGISQTRILQQIAISFPKEFSRPREQTCISCTAGRFFTTEPLFYRAWQKYLIFIIGTLGIYCQCGIFPLGIKGEFR